MQSIRTALLVVVLTLTQQLTAEAVGKDKNMTMVLEANGKTIVFLLNDSRASKDLMDQMPLTVKLADFGHNEKIFFIPRRNFALREPPWRLSTMPKRGRSHTMAHGAMSSFSLEILARLRDSMFWAWWQADWNPSPRCRDRPKYQSAPTEEGIVFSD